MATNTMILDSRATSIMLNLNISSNSSFIINQYAKSADKINKIQNEGPKKTYRSLKQTLKESYLTGALSYGNNFVM
jgi:hypothetical protein